MVSGLIFDLTDPQAPQLLAEALQKMGKSVDIVVNNAGFATYGPFAETSLKTEREMMQTNMQTLTELTKLFLQPMLNRNSGKILNVASTAAFQPGPFMAVYYATKAYVLSFSEALAQELSHTSITVTTLCPGPTATAFSERAGALKLFENLKVMDAATVALIAYKGLMKGKILVIPGLRNKILMESVRFLPRSWVTKIVKRLQAG